jgi:pimeloyl-ACP methyl ester carboxylesterase
VVVFPILGGSHVISELLSKVLVRRGFAVARLERRPLDLEAAPDVATVVERMRATILDGRRLVDWLEQHPRVDPQRIAAAGASLGGMQATCLAAVDGRVSGLILMLSGGGLPELLYDSAERPVQTFRDRILLKRGLDLEDRSGFVAAVEPQTRVVDPLTCAPAIPTASVYLATGRFDRVMPTSRSLALWEALRRPLWRKMPAGHYQAFPFLFGAVGRGVRLIETWWDQR